MRNKLNNEMYCEDCGKPLNGEEVCFINEYPYCKKCFFKNKYYKGIHDCDYIPNPVFHGIGKVYLKVELEVDNGGYLDENAEEVLNIANNKHEDRLYIRHNDKLKKGFVVISHPMTLSYHKMVMPWKEILDKLIEMEYECPENKTCNLYGYIRNKISPFNFNAAKYSDFKGTLKHEDFIILLQKAYKDFIKLY